MSTTDTSVPTAVDKPGCFLTIANESIFFEEDWATGIGGGLWSTGLAMGRYFQTIHASQLLNHLYETKKDRLTALELGSGNGFLAVCLMALGRTKISDLLVTDTKDHLDMIRTTLEANTRLCSMNGKVPGECRVLVLEHRWGEFLSDKDGIGETDDDIEIRLQHGRCTFDLILGSDLAYRKELYDPLIASLHQFSTPSTVILIGVTMADTTPEFFHKLSQAGFTYRRFADHLMEPEFRGPTFGIFLIQRKQPL